MAAPTIYESRVPWNKSRPDTVIISCVDGRWRAQIQDFTINYLKADLHADFLAVPGGIEPLTLFDLVPKDFNFFRRRLESLIEAHGTKRIVAIAHLPGPDDRDLLRTARGKGPGACRLRAGLTQNALDRDLVSEVGHDLERTSAAFADEKVRLVDPADASKRRGRPPARGMTTEQILDSAAR